MSSEATECFITEPKWSRKGREMALGLAEGVETQELYPPELRLWMQLWMKRIAHAILGYTVGSKPLFLPFCCSLADGSCLVEWLVGLLAFFFF